MAKRGNPNRAVVYCVTCLATGKLYIGITICGLESRWRAHLLDAKNRPSGMFHRAITKYGEQNFSIEQIASATSWEDACETEKTLIAQMNTMKPHGYNLTAGGDGSSGCIPSAETVLKRSLALRGRTFTPEHLAKIKAKNVWTPERRARHSVMRKALMASPEARAKLSAAKKAVMSDDYKAKLRLGRLGKKIKPEYREACIANAKRASLIRWGHLKRDANV